MSTITRIGAGLPLLSAGWIGLLAAVMAGSEEAPAALVLFPSEAFLERMPDHVAVSDRFSHAIALVSDRPGYVQELYANGARLVLPAGLAGCDPTT